MSTTLSRLTTFAWAVLAYNIGVILWGAYVRATGSGAGCGEHWPLCNGVVIPRDPSIATLIEFSHRITSGFALIAVVVLLIWVWRACAPGHPARRGAVWTVVFMLTEAAVGAGLVLFQLVADNASMARAMFMAVHLLNTFVLLAWLTLTAWWLSGGPPVRLALHPGRAAGFGLATAGLLLVGVSGAVAALGNTLYPDGSLAEGLAADLSPTSHFLIRLRILHPTFAVLTSVGLIFGASRLAGVGRRGHRGDRGVRRRSDPTPDARNGVRPRSDPGGGGGEGVRPTSDPVAPVAAGRLAHTVAWLAGIQLLAGAVNLILLAPVWMQLVHLLIADLLWIAFVLLGAAALAFPASARIHPAETAAPPVPVRVSNAR